MSAIEEFVDSIDDGDDERWHVQDVQSADWVARKLQRANRTIAEKQREHDAWLADLTAKGAAWLEHETAGARRDVQWAEAVLTDWLRIQRETDPDVKTIPLPSGVVLRSVANPARPKVTDRPKFLAWANEHWPDLVRRGEDSPDMAAIKRALRETGEVLPGVEIAEATVTYTVEAGDQ